MAKREIHLRVLVVAFVVSALSFQFASADRYSSTSYIIDASVMNNFGGTSDSSSYNLTSSGGEAVIGNGTGGSYKIGAGYVAQLEKSLSLTIQPSGLVAAYPLDETNGGTLAADQSAYNSYGQMQGAPNSVAGKVGTALNFNGSNQAVTAGNYSQVQLASAGTVEAWIKTSTSSGSLVAVSKASNFWLGIGSGKATTYDWTSSTTTSDTTVIADGNWHHIAITLNAGVANGSTLYVDGIAKKTFIWTPQYQSGILTIGAVYNGSTYSQYFNGAVDHVKVFNRALSAEEIAAEYSAQNSGLINGLSLGTITPGVSSTVLSDIIVQTDAGSYSLAINQDHNLTDGTNTIPAISGNIASPLAWTEGATKGLGFTLTATNATAIPVAWNSGNSYAAFPPTATTFYSRTGIPSINDYLTVRIRADVTSAQVSSDVPYTNTVTVAGTIAP